jgi:hypothetical protein
LKGGDGEDLVAVSSDATHSVTLVESSNALFLVTDPTPEDHAGVEISELAYSLHTCVSGHYEVRRLS